MCGIAGCYQQADGRKLVEIMTDRIAHRGPDAAGIWEHGDDRVTAQLGHRQLSIIDLTSAADQPLSKHSMTLVYNGELYNYQELRAELIAHGVRFTTRSDTEVVLEAWRSWGPEALRRFRGMFAFALLDERTSFSAPLRAWVRNDLREVIRDVLVDGELTGSGMIRREGLLRLIQGEQAGREDRAKQIWQLLTLELWYRHVRSMGVAG